MKRFPLMVASAAIGLALFAGIARHLTAETSSGTPPAGSCYYFMYTCSYGDTGGYWSNCQSGGSAGMIPTETARILCTTYNQ